MASPTVPPSPAGSSSSARATKRRGLVVRLTVAPAVLLVALALVWWHDRSGTSTPVDVVLLLLAAGAAYETAGMLRTGGAGASVPVAVVFSALLGGIGLLSHDPATRGAIRALLLAAAVVAAFLPHLRAPAPGDLGRLLGTLFPVVYVGFLFGLLREVGDGPRGARSIAFVVVASKASDIGGWIVGKTMGRHKMIPSVSPGKTWEGTIGGIAFSVGAAWLAAWALDWMVPLAPAALPAMVMGFALGAASIVAGLTHSALKRRCGVKDASALLPEMGGLLDMIDSLLLAAPAAWLLALLGVPDLR